MSIEQTNVIDFISIDRESGDVWLTISDHLSWYENESTHLQLLQDKLNAYLRFIESGEILKNYPRAIGKEVVINLVGKFPMSDQAKLFLRKAISAIENAGFRLQFRVDA